MHLQTLHELDQTEGTVQLRKPPSLTTKPDESTLLLIPHPSETDPNDPLLWPLWKKHVCFFASCLFTFMTNYSIGGLAPAFAVLSKEFDKSEDETSDLLLWPVLVLGLMNFFWVPLANYFGKRPVFVFSSLLLFLTCIWGAVAKSFKSLLWCNIVAAFAGATTETLVAGMVNDIYFLHERGSKMGIYMASISGGNTIGPLICGFVTATIGWRWHKGIAAIVTGINFLLVLFFVPETTFAREEPNSSGASKDITPGSSVSGSPAATEEITAHVTAQPKASSPTRFNTATRFSVPKKTYLQQLTLLPNIQRSTDLLKMFLRPFLLILYPAVTYSFLAYAVVLAWTVAVNMLAPFILSAPPYSFSPALLGLLNIAGLLGNLFGSLTGGWLVDRYSDWRARRARGVFRPETRLPLLVVPCVCVPAGCVLFGYAAERGWHWALLFVAYGLVAVGLTAVPIMTFVYVSDSYFPVSPDALLLINGLKNIVAFGFLYAIVPWVGRVGYTACFGTQAGIYVAVVVVLGVPLYVFGEKIRHRTARWRIILS
ncbi:uncharacterized protein K452DRAFT_258446 [Aplosporella prunicola CBS 121167]|uniref:Major facilitator superfamily (MFS) profile domain-containing protein n=1 Tax=Aplosporella prunicola CBS 121167 TaxID=1176127 RepID=A0A6A6B032_9PEZI|nr:uncharacterized protein K452DRAFT_258446 [Aplosporella prunicola CBS 121167]KAF2136898.1 hypothetical protein K452DRAFT_258446 [Aplosporella prunicola CBS 121167]